MSAHKNLGDILMRKHYAGAEKMYRKVIELDPSDAEAHLSLRGCLEALTNTPPKAKFIKP